MRKLYASLVLILCTLNSLCSQCNPNYKIVDPDNIWYFSSGGFTEPPYYFRIGFRKLPVEKDGRLFYEKLVSYKYQQDDWEGTGQFYNEEGGKIISVDKWGNQEVMFNYCAEIGDTIIDALNNDELEIIGKELIEFPNGDLRNKLIVKCINDQDNGLGVTFFIEGMGSERNGVIGYFLNCGFYDGFEYLLCYEYKHQKVFSNTDNCWWGNSDILHTYNLWHVDVITDESPDGATHQYRFYWDDIEKNGKTYRELYKATEAKQFPKFNPTGRYFREENNKILEFKENDVEELTFDFNLNEGESVNLKQGHIFIVSKVDSIIYNDEIERKRIELFCDQNPDFKITWIEGIGDMKTFVLDDTQCVGESDNIKLRCFSSSLQNVYIAPWADGCFLTSVKDGDEQFKIVVYPNPANGKINIKFGGNFEVSSFIYDITGRLVNVDTSNGDGTEIDISQLESGMYVIKLLFKNTGEMHFGNFIKN